MKYEDLAVSWLPFTYTTGSVGFLEEPLYHYRMNPKGSSLGVNPKKNGDIFWGRYCHYVYACEHMPEAVDMCLAKCLGAALLMYDSALFHPEKIDDERLVCAQNILDENKKNFWNVKSIPLQRKVRLFLYFWLRPIYNSIAHYKEKRSV